MNTYALLVALSLAVTAPGCTRYHRVQRDALESVVRAGGTPRRADGSTIRGREPWLEDDLQSVRQTSHARGALEGGAIGMISGSVVGAIAGYAMGDDDSDNYFALSANEKAVVVGGAFGVAGGALGLALGALAGSRDVYVAAPPSAAPPVRVTVTPRTLGLSFDF